MTDRGVVLVVLEEPGADPAAAFGEDGAFSRRFYAERAARAEAPEGLAAPRPLPADVERLVAAKGDEALREARARAPRGPILLMHAGERLAAGGVEPETRGSSRGAPRSGSPVSLDLSIRVAGKETRHTPWFGGRRAAWASVPGAAPRAPAIRATRDPGDLSAILALLVRDALATAAPRGPVGVFRLLAEPLLTTARIALAGGLRDGFRGVLLSALHGLHRLIVLARAWRRSENPASEGAR